MATSTRASKNDHMTTLEFVFSLIARWIRSLTDMYSCSCLTPKKRIICENVRQIKVDDPDFWRCQIAYFAYIKLKQKMYFTWNCIIFTKTTVIFHRCKFCTEMCTSSWKCEKYFVKTIYTKEVTKELNDKLFFRL